MPSKRCCIAAKAFAWTLCFVAFFFTVGNAELTITSACSITEDDPVDIFRKDPGPQIWPTGRTRKLKARGCRPSKGRVTYFADQEGDIPLDCGRCTLFDLDVRATSTRKGSKCWGLMPELLQSRHDCLFKNQCQLSYRKSLITWSPEGQRSCMGEWPKRLETSMTCVNTEKHPVSDVIKSVQHTRSRYGLIRSHFYDRRSKSRYPKGDASYPPVNTLVLHAPDTTTNQTFVLLHVHSFDLREGDQLLVQGESLTCQTPWSVDGTYSIPTGTLPQVSLVFTRGDDTAGSGHGFEICFQWFTASDMATVQAQFETALNMCRRYFTQLKAVRGLPVFDIIQHTSTQHTSGIVRSHPDFPWNYPRPQGAPSPCRAGGSSSKLSPTESLDSDLACSQTVHELKAPMGLSKLRITVRNLRLAEDDQLDIIGGNGAAFRARSDQSLTLQGESVTLRFTIHNSHQRHTDQGFLLCYKWFSPTSVTPIDSDLCGAFALKVRCQKTKRKGGNQKKQSRRRRRRKMAVRHKLPKECRIR